MLLFIRYFNMFKKSAFLNQCSPSYSTPFKLLSDVTLFRVIFINHEKTAPG